MLFCTHLVNWCMRCEFEWKSSSESDSERIRLTICHRCHTSATYILYAVLHWRWSSASWHRVVRSVGQWQIQQFKAGVRLQECAHCVQKNCDDNAQPCPTQRWLHLAPPLDKKRYMRGLIELHRDLQSVPQRPARETISKQYSDLVSRTFRNAIW